MKNILGLAVIALIAFAAPQARADVYSLNVVGYYNYPFYFGDNLFQNNLRYTNNLVSVLFPQVPDGTAISLWNPGANAFDRTAQYMSGTWSDDFTLLPGTGARLTSPSTSPFTNTFVGEVVTRDGGPFHDPPFALPPPFSGPNGVYLLGDILPVLSTGIDVFLDVLGRLPNIGEQFTRLDASSQTYITSTYLGAGAWDNVPSITVGEAGFFNIVPEPSVTALGLLGLALFRGAFRRKP